MKFFAEITTVANKYTNSFFLNVVEEPAQTDNNEIFLFPSLFWYWLTSIIQFKNSKPTLVNGLYNLYAEKIIGRFGIWKIFLIGFPLKGLLSGG